VMPGKYTVSMALRVNGVTTPISGSQTFNIIVEGREKMSGPDLQTLSDFQRKVSMLQRSVGAAVSAANEAKTRIGLLKRSAADAPVDNARFVAQADTFENEIDSIINALRGGRENSDIPPPTINDRIGYVAERIRLSTVRPSATQLEQFDLTNAEFQPV